MFGKKDGTGEMRYLKNLSSEELSMLCSYNLTPVNIC